MNAEHNAFKKAARKVALDHCEEANENLFCQFAHDGAVFLNKDKHQAFGMHFSDNKFRHNNAIVLSFRKLFSREAYKVAELAKEACNDRFELDFTRVFSSSV